MVTAFIQPSSPKAPTFDLEAFSRRFDPTGSIIDNLRQDDKTNDENNESQTKVEGKRTKAVWISMELLIKTMHKKTFKATNYPKVKLLLFSCF